MSNWIDTIFETKWRFNRQGALAKLSHLVASAIDGLFVWQERAKQRRDLSRLDGRMLKDIGVDPSNAWRETQKPFWQR